LARPAIGARRGSSRIVAQQGDFGPRRHAPGPDFEARKGCGIDDILSAAV
jgi:hypothetical protein